MRNLPGWHCSQRTVPDQAVLCLMTNPRHFPVSFTKPQRLDVFHSWYSKLYYFISSQVAIKEFKYEKADDLAFPTHKAMGSRDKASGFVLMEKLVQWIVQRSRCAQGQGQDWSPVFLTPNPPFFLQSNGVPRRHVFFLLNCHLPGQVWTFHSIPHLEIIISHPSTARPHPK